MYNGIWILIAAVLLDVVLAEPPARVHLTVWAGQAIGLVEKHGLGIRRSANQFVFGMAASIAVITVFGGFTFWILGVFKSISQILFFTAAVLLLKPTFCLRFNNHMSLLVEKYLAGDNHRLEKADEKIRYLLKTVERDDNDNSIKPVVSSTVRSLAENASDFLVAPLFYFLIFGVPGAVAYRVANTLDGMLGHHGKYEYLGKFAAYLDDILSFIPARITALMFVFAAKLSRFDAAKSWQMMLRDHSKTESPNAGWPMAAAAGALRVKLDRAGQYALGDSDRQLGASTIGEAARLFRVMAAIDIVFCIGILLIVAWNQG